MTETTLFDEFHLQEFQKRTVRHVYARMFEGNQRRFLVADEVGLGKTKVAKGVIAQATIDQLHRNVLYLASSGHIVSQNLSKLKSKSLVPQFFGSLCLLAEYIYRNDVEGKLIGLTPIKDLRSDHFGSVRERALLYRLLFPSHRTLMSDPEVRKFFMGSRVIPEVFDRYATGPLPKALRHAFGQNLRVEIIERLRDPHLRKKHKRSIVGELRAILAKCALQKLDPALVVVDEIQRFSDHLLKREPTPQVEYLLGRPMLVLSATPYQPGDAADHAGKDPHKGFIELVEFLNCDHPHRVIDVKDALSAMRAALLASEIHKSTLQKAVDDLGNHLLQFMVRTERPFDAHVERLKVEAPVDARDLKALHQAMKLLEGTSPSAKNKQHRFAELVDLWKSAPYIVSALSRRYVTGRDFAKAVRQRLPSPAALTSSQLYREAPLLDPVHPRLRAMIRAMGDDAVHPRLWLPPTRPYVRNAGTTPDNKPSKTLVFTSWGAAPPAIATALNLRIEPRPGREKDLEFSRATKSNSKGSPVRSVHAIGAPMWRFAEDSDPFDAVRRADGPLSPAKLVSKVRQQLVNSGSIKVSQAARPQNLVDLALGLNAHPAYPGISPQAASYLEPARELMREVAGIDQATVTRVQANELAEIAVAAPGTCAYRALLRGIPALYQDRTALFGAAISIGNSITRLFQRPAAVAIVGESNKKMPYWRQVLRFCLEHDLQSVLDEYVFLLVQDSSEELAGKLAYEIADTIQVALSTVGGLQVARPKPNAKAPYGAAMYARALGEHDSPVDDNPTIKKRFNPLAAKLLGPKGRHLNPLLTAFNSPFPPFVLTTTSTGQEGLDMHRYCRRLVHWNIPSSPLALEQREGRVDRYLSLGVRTNIAKLNFPHVELNATHPPAHPWQLLVAAAKAQTTGCGSILAPLWHFGEGQPIKAIAVNIPFSREETAWERLLEEASWYRLVLGQPDPHALLNRLSNGSESNRREIVGVRLDLSPRITE